jgi:putative FmdB family regulatory protein
MPTYEFRCPQGHEFEKFYRSISGAEAQAVCPQCGRPAERMMSAAGFAFKGSGFYLTDYGKNAHRGTEPVTASGEGARGEGKGDATGDAKGDAKSEARGDAKSEARGDAKSEAKGDAKSEAKGDAKSDGGSSGGASAAKPAAPKAADAKPATAPVKKSSSE